MGTPLHWIAFNLFIAVAIAMDLRIFHRRPHKIEIREAALASFGWIAVSVLFGFGVLYFYGEQLALEFFTGYLIEKALSVDNLFLFLVIFRAFAVDERLQHRLLEWGVVGALLMHRKRAKNHQEKKQVVRSEEHTSELQSPVHLV